MLRGIPAVIRTQTHTERGSTHRRIAGNIVSLYALQGLNYVIPMAVLPYLVRVLGMEMYGRVAFAQSLALFFTVLTDYGFNFTATRAIAQHRNDVVAISRTFCSVYLIKILLLFAGAILFLTMVRIVPRAHDNLDFFLAAYLAVIGNAMFPTWYFQGMEKMRYISVVVGASKAAGAIALFIFVHRPADALLSLAIQSLVFIVSGVVGLCVAFRSSRISITRPSLTDLKTTLAEGWHLFVSTSATSLYSNTNVFLVGVLAGNVQAGYFSAAERLVRAIQGLTLPVSQAVFPHMNSLAIQSRELATRFAAKTLKWMIVITLPPSVLFLVFANPITILCFGKASAGSVIIVRTIALLPVLIAITNVLGIQTMISFGLDKQYSRILLSAGLFNVLLATALVHLFQARGAGMSLLIIEFLITTAMMVILRQHKIRIFDLQEAVHENAPLPASNQ